MTVGAEKPQKWIWPKQLGPKPMYQAEGGCRGKGQQGFSKWALGKIQDKGVYLARPKPNHIQAKDKNKIKCLELKTSCVPCASEHSTTMTKTNLSVALGIAIGGGMGLNYKILPLFSLSQSPQH